MIFKESITLEILCATPETPSNKKYDLAPMHTQIFGEE